jgi:hypothetical protein
VQHVGIVAPEPGQFLRQAVGGLRHEGVVAGIPAHVAVRDDARHPVARRLDRVFADGLGVEWRQVAMPEHVLCDVDLSHVMGLVDPGAAGAGWRSRRAAARIGSKTRLPPGMRHQVHYSRLMREHQQGGDAHHAVVDIGGLETAGRGAVVHVAAQSMPA